VHAEAITLVHAPVLGQHAPTGQLFATQVVPTPLNVCVVVVPQPAMVLMEHAPVVAQQAPTKLEHGPGQGTPSP